MLIFSRVVFWIGILFFLGCIVFLAVYKLSGKKKNKKNYK